MVVAQNPAHASEGVLAKLAGRLVLSQVPKDGNEMGGRAQGVGVVVTQNPAHASEGIFAKLAGRLMLLQVP